MRKFLCAVLASILCISLLAGCAAWPQETEPSKDPFGDGKSCQVMVTNLAGTPLSGVNVAVYADDTLEDLVYVGKTDNDGIYSVDGACHDGYVAVLSKLPVGYAAKDAYPLEGEKTQIRLGAGTMTQEDMDTVRYSLGDAVMDFTVTVSDGTELGLSQLLREKEAVMINFWFMECGPCRSEFPHIQEAYEKYSDKIAVLALNPVDSDNASIESFRQDNGYTFPMGKCDPRWSQILDTNAFPYTIIIDRFGNLSLIHLGAVPDAQVFMDVFEYYSAEDYEQAFFTGIDQIPVK